MTHQYDDISVVLHDHVAVVEIQRPPHNFFDVSLIRQIANAFDVLDDDLSCRSIVLASEGKSFCAGANFGSGGNDESASDEFTEQGFMNTTGTLYREGVRLFSARKPIVAAIQGAAIPEARFSANFVKLGIHPGFGLTVTLPAIVGQQAANLMFLTGRRLKGEEALSLGLVDELVEQTTLRDRAIAFASEIAENAPLAIVSVRATARQGLAEKIDKATDHELAEQQWLRATNDAEEGIKAVAERRVGRFTGT